MLFATVQVVCSNFDLVTEQAVANATALAKQLCFTGNGFSKARKMLHAVYDAQEGVFGNMHEQYKDGSNWNDYVY